MANIFKSLTKELEKSELDLVVAGTKDAVLMVESETSGLSRKSYA